MNPRLSFCAAIVAMAGATMPLTVSADAFSGVYVGGSLGIFTGVSIEEENDSGILYDGEVVTFGIEETFPSKADLLIGFGHRMNDLYLGIEASYTISNEADDRIRRYDSGLEEYAALGDGRHVGARIGYLLDASTLGYLKIAAAERNIEIYGDPYSEDEDFSGSGYGIGIERHIGSQLTARLEATRFDYSNETLSFSGNEFHYDPVETSVDLALMYHF